MAKITQPQVQPTNFKREVIMYVIGFLLAVILTLVAYFMTINHVLTGMTLVTILMILAAVQLMVQLVFFLHLGRDKSARWNIASFYFMMMVLVIVVLGSLWIMHNLNYNMMMTPEQMNEFMLKESMKGF